MVQNQSSAYCAFCEIVAHRAPATIHYQDTEVIVISNRLTWVPVMLLVIPQRHMSQEEMWRNGVLDKVGDVAVKMGKVFCPQGFRLLSNFGSEAMQSESHGHLHILGGTPLGRYA